MEATSGAKERLAFLDFARGLAALAVVLAHALAACSRDYLDWALANVEMGRVGVILFLMISGFIIPSSLEHGGSLGKFCLRRFFRLFPAYWLSIAAGFLYLTLGGPVPLGTQTDDARTWLLNLTMCQGFLGVRDIWGVFWTLKLELIIYAACALLFVCGLLRRVGWGVGMTLLLAYPLVGMPRPLFMGKPYLINVFRMEYLLLAALIGLIAQRYWAGRISRQRFYTFVACQPLPILFVWGLNKALYPDAEARGLLSAVINWGLAYAAFLILLEARHLRMPALGLWLGRVSYSIYLFHPLVLILLLAANCPVWLLVPALLAGTLALSALTYYGVEEPGIQLGRALERRLFAPRPRPAVDVPPAKAA